MPLMSASAVRYNRAFRQLLERLPGLGRTRSILFTLPQNWQLYGVHAVDVMHAVFGVGAVDVTSIRNESGDVVTIRWPDGQVGVANQVRDAWMGMLCVALGENAWTHAEMHEDDTIDGFPRMYLETIKEFLAMLKSGEPPISAREMVDVIRVVAAAERSATSQARRVPLTEMPALLAQPAEHVEARERSDQGADGRAEGNRHQQPHATATGRGKLRDPGRSLAPAVRPDRATAAR